MISIFESKKVIAIFTVIMAALLGHLLVCLMLKVTGAPKHSENGMGTWIGIFERSLVALFICIGLTSQTVFIFAVKTAVMGFRISEEDKDKKRNMAEYMLLGTMISYFVALAIGLAGRLAMGLPLKG